MKKVPAVTIYHKRHKDDNLSIGNFPHQEYPNPKHWSTEDEAVISIIVMHAWEPCQVGEHSLLLHEIFFQLLLLLY